MAKDDFITGETWVEIDKSSSQPVKVNTNAPDRSHWSDTLTCPVARWESGPQKPKLSHSADGEDAALQPIMEEPIMSMKTRHLQQDLVLGEQMHNQASLKQEALLGCLLCQRSKLSIGLMIERLSQDDMICTEEVLLQYPN